MRLPLDRLLFTLHHSLSHRQVHVDPCDRQPHRGPDRRPLRLGPLDLPVRRELPDHPGEPAVQETPRDPVEPWSAVLSHYVRRECKQGRRESVGGEG